MYSFVPAWLLPFVKPILWTVAVVVIVGATYAYGHHSGYKQKEAEQQSAIIKSVQAQLASIQTEVHDVNSKKDQIHVVTVRATNEIIKYVPTDRKCDLPPDAVRLLNATRGSLSPAVPK